MNKTTKELNMKPTLKNNEVVKYKTWNDDAFTTITRNNNTVTIETIYRYAPQKKRTISYKGFCCI